MPERWKEVVRLAFNGRRFQDHALDLSALDELVQFQKIVTETAKALWRAANPDRERLPKHFEERIRLCLRKIEEGSAVAPLEVYVGEIKQEDLYEPGVGPEPVEITQAITLARETFHAIERNEPIPETLPRALVPEYSKWGQQLLEDESIELIQKGKRPARITATSQSRWNAFVEPVHENRAEIIGTILEVDVHQGHFQIWLNERAYITAVFRADQEELVTTALKDHSQCKVQVKGRGEFTPSGKLIRITDIEEIKLFPIGETKTDLLTRPIEDVLTELASGVSPEEWKKLPPDLSDNLDHYLYGWPKR